MMILKYSFPFALLYLLMSFYARTDSVFIERLLKGDLGNRQVGIFAMGYRILDAANQFAMLFGMLLFPIYSRLLKQKRPLLDMVILPSKLLLTVAFIIAIASWFYRFEIMELLYPMQGGEPLDDHVSKIDQAGDIYGILMFGLLGTCLMTIFSSLLSANDNLKQLNVIAAIGIAVNFTMNLTLIPILQATGAAWANLGTQVFTGIAFVVVVQNKFHFKIRYQSIIQPILFLIIVILAGWLSTYFSDNWLLNLSAMLVFSFLTAMVLKLLDLKAFRNILLQRNIE
jgi:O-antigen/teichoic acid export membrane protein